MISRVRGTILTRGVESVEIETSGGVVYEVFVPLTVMERIPGVGSEVELRTVHVVREDHTALYGFGDAGERALFQRLLSASGVGPKLALTMLSTYAAPRLARILMDKEVGALVQVSGIGKKTAERLVLELADRMGDLAAGDEGSSEAGAVAQAGVRALMALGMSFQEADAAIRGALDDEVPQDVNDLVRKALVRR